MSTPPSALLPHRLKVILLSGASGTGKSTTAYEVCARLRSSRRGQRPSRELRGTIHAHIDADNLDALYPRADDGNLMLRALRALWEVLWGEMRGALDAEEEEEGALAVLVISGTGVVLEMEGIRRVVEDVVTGDMGVSTQSHVNIEVVPVVLGAEEHLVDGRLRGRVLGEELQEHLQSSSKFRRVLAEWEPTDAVVRRVDSGRDLKDVVEDVLRVCGL